MTITGVDPADGTAAPALVVRTVLGAIDPADLGITMAHEHLWMDSTPLLEVHSTAPTAEGPGIRRSRRRRAGTRASTRTTTA